MKRMFSFFLALALLAVLSGCGKREPTPSRPDEPTPPPEEGITLAELNVEFVAGERDTDALMQLKKELPPLLIGALADEGVTVGRVNVTFGASDEATADALARGARRIVLGLGGSATNDGGCGCAAALGVRFTDAGGKSFVPVGATLDRIAHIDASAVRERLHGVRVIAMCDITNPMHGHNGAAHIFAPQKGADEAAVRELDRQLRALDETFRRELNASVTMLPGAGAAGAFGAGCVALLGAELRRGIEVVLDVVGFDALLTDADLVITGEGRIDSQSADGKVVSGIARRTRAKGVPLIAIAGGIADSAGAVYDIGVSAMFSTDRAALPVDMLGARSPGDYEATLSDIMSLIAIAERFA